MHVTKGLEGESFPSKNGREHLGLAQIMRSSGKAVEIQDELRLNFMYSIKTSLHSELTISLLTSDYALRIQRAPVLTELPTRYLAG